MYPIRQPYKIYCHSLKIVYILEYNYKNAESIFYGKEVEGYGGDILNHKTEFYQQDKPQKHQKCLF